MSRVLDRPGRAVGGLTLAGVTVVGGVMSVAVGQVPTLLVGLVAVGAYLAALRGFEGETAATTLLGSAALVVAAIAGTLALVVSVGLAARTGIAGPVGVDDLVETTARSLVGLCAVLATLGAVASATRPSPAQFRAPLLALWYAAVITGVGFAAAVGVDFGVGATAGTVASFAGAVADTIRALQTYNQVTGLAVRLTLLGVVLLPLRLVRTRRLYAEAGHLLRAGLSSGDTNETGAGGEGHNETETTGGTWKVPPGTVAGAVLLLVGIVLARLGGRTPQGTTVGELYPGLSPLTPVVGAVVSAPLVVAVLLWLVTIVVGLVVAHPVLVRLLRFPWRRYERRLVRAATPTALVVLSVPVGPLVVAVLRRTPALHLVYVVPGGRLPTVENGQLRLAPAAVDGSGLTRASGEFLSTLSVLVDAIGPVALVLAPVVAGVVVLFGGLLLAGVAWVVARRITDGQVIAGWLLFVAAAGVALAGGPRAVMLAGGLAGVWLWDLDERRQTLAERVDADATTTRGELVHVGGTVAVLGTGLLVAAGGRRATRELRPVLRARPAWQVVLGLSVVVLGTGVVALALVSRTGR